MIGYAHDLDELKRWAAAQAKSMAVHSSREAIGFAEAMREAAKSPITVEMDFRVWATMAVDRALVERGLQYWRGYSMAMRDIAGSVVHPRVEIPRHQKAFMEQWQVSV